MKRDRLHGGRLQRRLGAVVEHERLPLVFASGCKRPS